VEGVEGEEGKKRERVRVKRGREGDEWLSPIAKSRIRYTGLGLSPLRQEAQLPLRNRASATYFFVAKLISIAHSCL